MSKANNLTDFLTDLANTIRTKKGTSGSIDPQDFSSEISSISSGMGVGKVYNIKSKVDGDGTNYPYLLIENCTVADIRDGSAYGYYGPAKFLIIPSNRFNGTMSVSNLNNFYGITDTSKYYMVGFYSEVIGYNDGTHAILSNTFASYAKPTSTGTSAYYANATISLRTSGGVEYYTQVGNDVKIEIHSDTLKSAKWTNQLSNKLYILNFDDVVNVVSSL